jgi:hypothetical protein
MTRNLIKELFPKLRTNLRTITLLPPLARRLGRFTPILYPMLSAIPILRTHYLGLLVKPDKLTERAQKAKKGTNI